MELTRGGEVKNPLILANVIRTFYLWEGEGTGAGGKRRWYCKPQKASTRGFPMFSHNKGTIFEAKPRRDVSFPLLLTSLDDDPFVQ